MQAGLHLLCPLCLLGSPPEFFPSSGGFKVLASVPAPRLRDARWRFCRAGVPGGASPFFLSCDYPNASLALECSVLGVDSAGRPEPGLCPPAAGTSGSWRAGDTLLCGGLGAEPSLWRVSGPCSLASRWSACCVWRCHLRAHPAWSSLSFSCVKVLFLISWAKVLAVSPPLSCALGPVLCALVLDGALQASAALLHPFPFLFPRRVPPTCPRSLSLLPAPACRGAVQEALPSEAALPVPGACALLCRTSPFLVPGPPGLRGHPPGSPAPAAKRPAARWAFQSPLLTSYFLVFPLKRWASLCAECGRGLGAWLRAAAELGLTCGQWA